MARSLIDTDFQISVYKKYKNKIFQENRKAVSCSHGIYSSLTQELIGMTPKAIQTSINRLANVILSDPEVSNPIEFVAVEINSESTNTQTLASAPLHDTLNQSNADESTDSFFSNTSITSERLNNELMKLYHPNNVRCYNAERQLDVELNTIRKAVDEVKNAFERLKQQTTSDHKSTTDHLLEVNAEFALKETKANSEIEDLRCEVVRLQEINQSVALNYEQKLAGHKSTTDHQTDKKEKSSTGKIDLKQSKTKKRIRVDDNEERMQSKRVTRQSMLTKCDK